MTTAPTRRDAQANTRARRPNQNSVELVNLANGQKTTIAKIRRFTFAGEAGGWIAMHRYGATPATGGGRLADVIPRVIVTFDDHWDDTLAKQIHGGCGAPRTTSEDYYRVFFGGHKEAENVRESCIRRESRECRLFIIFVNDFYSRSCKWRGHKHDEHE